MAQNHRDVAHKWANRTGAHGKAGNMFFDGPSIYSWGRHFEIARHVIGRGAVRVVLFTTRGYSNSTAKHKSITRRALDSGGAHGALFLVPNVGAQTREEHDANARAMIAEALMFRDRARRALAFGPSLARQAEEQIKRAALYCATFPVKPATTRKVKVLSAEGALFTTDDRLKMDARRIDAEHRAELRDERARVEQERRTAELAERHALALSAWLAGDPARLPWGVDGGKARLRLIEGGRKIETTQGAVVGARAALALWAAIEGGRDVVGVSVNGFTVRSWDGETLVIGCHRIMREELARVAPLVRGALAALGADAGMED